MSANVDVLSVLDQAIERERQAGQATVAQIAARAAVVELIESASNAMAEIDGTGFFGPGNVRIEELRAALKAARS